MQNKTCLFDEQDNKGFPSCQGNAGGISLQTLAAFALSNQIFEIANTQGSCQTKF
jgi:hypothetical protein